MNGRAMPDLKTSSTLPTTMIIYQHKLIDDDGQEEDSPSI